MISTNNRKRFNKNYFEKQPIFRLVPKKAPKNIDKTLKKNENFQLMVNAIQTYVLSNLLRNTDYIPPLYMDVTIKTMRFLQENFGITKRFTYNEKFYKYLTLKDFQFVNNCQQNNNTKILIKSQSFQIKSRNARKVISTDQINGQIFINKIERNQSIGIKFEKDRECPLNKTQSEWVNSFINNKLSRRVKNKQLFVFLVF
jgi:hypothetical protein